jgi:hypothetical protein
MTLLNAPLEIKMIRINAIQHNGRQNDYFYQSGILPNVSTGVLHHCTIKEHILDTNAGKQ